MKKAEYGNTTEPASSCHSRALQQKEFPAARQSKLVRQPVIQIMNQMSEQGKECLIKDGKP